MQRYNDCPQILREFLIYHENIKGQSQLTISEYYLDLRMFLRFVMLMRKDMPITTRLEDIDIKGVDLNIDDDGNKKKSKYRKILTPEEKAQTRAACRKRIENWIRTDGQKLLNLSDPDAVIKQLKKLAKNYEAEMAMMRGGINRRTLL